MRPEPGIAAYLGDALDFAKNVQVALVAPDSSSAAARRSASSWLR